MTGTESQLEWAERIRIAVGADFDRVTAAFQAIAANQSGEKLADTEAILAIVAERRDEVLGNEQAGYFIQHWQEINDQVRQLIFNDPRFQAIRNKPKA